MVLIDYVPPVSWTDKGMDWENPDPANVDYINALKLALQERGFGLALNIPFEIFRIDSLNGIALILNRNWASQRVVFYDPISKADYYFRGPLYGRPLLQINDNTDSSVSELNLNSCLHSDIVDWLKNARNAINRMVCPSGLWYTVKRNYKEAWRAAFEKDKSYAQVVEEAISLLQLSSETYGKKTIDGLSFYQGLMNVNSAFWSATYIHYGADEHGKLFYEVGIFSSELELDFSNLLPDAESIIRCYIAYSAGLPYLSGSPIRVFDPGEISITEGYGFLLFDVTQENPKIKLGDVDFYPVLSLPELGPAVLRGFFCGISSIILDMTHSKKYRFV